MIIAPLAIPGDGDLHLHWRRSGDALCGTGWAPTLFGLRLITFWQAIGLLALCRILFGGFGLGGGGHRNSRRRMEGRIRERVRERMAERWEQMDARRSGNDSSKACADVRAWRIGGGDNGTVKPRDLRAVYYSQITQMSDQPTAHAVKKVSVMLTATVRSSARAQLPRVFAQFSEGAGPS